MTPSEITITISDRAGRVSAETLIRTLEQTLRLLKAIQAESLDAGIVVTWNLVRATMRSPLKMTFSPTASKRGVKSKGAERKLVRNVLEGVRRLEKGKPPPSTFQGDALDATKSILKQTRMDDTRVTFRAPNRPPVTLTKRAEQTINRIERSVRRYSDFASIEGRLEEISIHGEPTITIWETLTNAKVKCIVDRDRIDYVNGFLGRRVIVSGRVHYRDHVPRRIEVEGDIRILRESRDLPLPSEIGPVNITDGVASEDHVRMVRNG